ncbi:hypothetical protein WN943_026991 [Citrus x changshan-huyou]
MKGQALTDLLGVGAHPLQENSKLQKELPDEAVYCAEVASRPTSKAWEMYFDCASKTDEKGRLKSGVGIVFIITPKGNMIPHSFTLSESCSNNVSEYTALIMGMELARDIKVHQLEAKQLTKQALKDAHRVLLSKEALAEGSSYVHPLLSHFGLRRSLLQGIERLRDSRRTAKKAPTAPEIT